DRVYFGEISLSGAVRPTGHMMARLKEARKLGFKHAVLPAAGGLDVGPAKIGLTRIDHVKGLAGAPGPWNCRSNGRYCWWRGLSQAIAAAQVARKRNVSAQAGSLQPRKLRMSGIGPFTILDIALLAIIFISGMVAMYRGLTREVLSILSWVIAAGAVAYFIK